MFKSFFGKKLPTAAGLVSFVKSGINGVGMVVTILRRHDIIYLIKQTSVQKVQMPAALLISQKHSLSLGCLGYVGAFAAVTFFGKQGIESHLHFTFGLFTTAIYWLVTSALLQGLLASGQYSLLTKINLTSVFINLIFFTALLPTTGMYSIIAGEFAMCTFQLWAYFKRGNQACGS